jgi:hypothetical protein
MYGRYVLTADTRRFSKRRSCSCTHYCTTTNDGKQYLELDTQHQETVDPDRAFHRVQVFFNLSKDCYHFGSTAYVLHNAMVAGKKIDKWSERTRVHIYLGRSPQHARTGALVLSLTTGLASP